MEKNRLHQQEIATQLDGGLHFSILLQNGAEERHGLVVPLLQRQKNRLGMKKKERAPTMLYLIIDMERRDDFAFSFGT